MAYTSMSEDDMKAYLIRKLGSGIIDVELTNEHLQDIFDDTKRWFAFRLGQKRYIQLPLVTSTNVYVLDPDVTEVLQVILPTTHFPAVDTDDFSYTYSMLFGQWRSPGASPMPYSDLVQRLQYLKTSSKIFSADREFDYNADTHELQIMPRPSIVGNALVQVWTKNIDVRDFQPEDQQLFLRYLVAHAKETLGEIRDKHDALPDLGGDRSLNGEKLMERAAKEKEQIEKDIIHWRRAVPIILG
jgi:hypothetical protein